MRNDFYGDGIKWFIGVVKDTEDPYGANRVRLRIKGIHPDEGDEAMASPVGGGSGSGLGTGQQGSGSNSNVQTVQAASLQDIDESNLPNAGQLSMKISKNFTLANLTVGAAGAQSRNTSRLGINNGLLTPEIIKNLSNLATNVLDPIHDGYGPFRINSGWRIGVSKADKGSSGGNHPKGYAADIAANRGTPGELADWIKQNLHGRYNFMIVYPTFVHIQLGGSQGSLQNPMIRKGS